MQAADASIPDPPYSGETVTPRSPRSPSRRNTSVLNFSSLLGSKVSNAMDGRRLFLMLRTGLELSSFHLLLGYRTDAS